MKMNASNMCPLKMQICSYDDLFIKQICKYLILLYRFWFRNFLLMYSPQKVFVIYPNYLSLLNTSIRVFMELRFDRNNF